MNILIDNFKIIDYNIRKYFLKLVASQPYNIKQIPLTNALKRPVRVNILSLKCMKLIN